MKRLPSILLLACCILSGCGSARQAARQEEHPVLKICSFNILEPKARRNMIREGRLTSDQRYWCNSVSTVAMALADLDPDLIGLQEVGDSTFGTVGSYDLRTYLRKQTGRDDYGWVFYPNTAKGLISFDVAIGFRKDKFKLLKSGIFWLGGQPDRPYPAQDIHKSFVRPTVWVTLQHLSSGRKVNFICTHLRVDSDSTPPGGNMYNSKQLVKLATERFPADIPSIIVGDFNQDARVGKLRWEASKSGRWTDVFETLDAQGALGGHILTYGTQAKKDESGFGTWRPDHILYDGFVPLSFDIDRRMFPTRDGTLHFPSDHCPITAELQLL